MLRDGSFERAFAKENDEGGGKASFARFWHPDTRSVYYILFHVPAVSVNINAVSVIINVIILRSNIAKGSGNWNAPRVFLFSATWCL